MASETDAPIIPLTPRTGRGMTEGWIGALVIVISTVLAYYPALRGEFVWDDSTWVGRDVEDLLRDTSGLARMWVVPGALQQYFPLTGTTFWLDHHFWGEWTMPYHLENVLLHSVSAVLFWRLLRRLEVPGAWVAGAIFALHPVMVESVAWITERKNVLSQVLFLGALLQYGKFTTFWTDAAAQRRWTPWILALFLFLGAVLAKISTFSLPACILLIGWWKRGRISWKDDVLPALPFFALAPGLGLVAVWMELYNTGAVGPDWNLTWSERPLIAGRALWFYLGKLLWPADLNNCYPRWQPDTSAPAEWLLLVSFVFFMIALWTARWRIGRGPVTAFLFFAGTLLPILGFMNVYGMLYSSVADRWVYLPSLGIFALVVALAVRCTERYAKPGLNRALTWALLPLLAILTWRHAGTFQNDFTLWQDGLKHNPDSWMAHTNLGNFLVSHGKVDEAIQHYEKSLQVRPDAAITHNSLAVALWHKNRLEEAVGHFESAVKLKPDYGAAHRNCAGLLMSMGRGGEALVHTCYAVTLPTAEKRWDELAALAWILGTCPDASLRNGGLAVELAQKANKVSNSSNPEVLEILAAAYAEAGRFKDAVETAQRALVLAGQKPLADDIRLQLEFYLKNEPFRDEKRRAVVRPASPKK